MAHRYLPALLVLALAVSATAQTTNNETVSEEDEAWGWCVSSETEKATCDDMVAILTDLDPEEAHVYSCIVGDGAEDCMKKINSGEAKVGVFDGGNIRKASRDYSLKPIRIEITGTSTDKYFAVGIVKKDNCPGDLGDLEGRRSCHSGYGRSAGWTIPMTYLIDNEIIPLEIAPGNGLNDIESVTNFFSKTCAASNDPTKSICTGCKTTSGCTTSDTYYDYEGAFRGVVEDACDIAFTKHSIPIDYASGGRYAQSSWTGLQPASEYSLLCPNPVNGQRCVPVTDYAACNFGSAPPHTIFAYPTWPQVEIDEFNEVMDAANSDPRMNDLLFSGKNTAGNIFVADATKTLEYAGTVDALSVPIEEAASSLERINAADAPAGGAAVTVPVSLSAIVVAAAVAAAL